MMAHFLPFADIGRRALRSALCLVFFYARDVTSGHDNGHPTGKPSQGVTRGRSSSKWLKNHGDGCGGFELAEGWKTVGDAKEENEPNAEAIDSASPCDQVENGGMVAADVEGSAHGCGHQGVHRKQA